MNNTENNPNGNTMLSGAVFNIQRFSVQDGPGIRTIVFLKGCPLKCLWCCNPESQTNGRELLFDSRRCIDCGRCLTVCPENVISAQGNMRIIDRNRCTGCGDCADTCYSGALEMIGEQKSVQDVIGEIVRDSDIYRNSHGGVTLSGGEPMQQSAFSIAILKSCKFQNIHTAIETCGFSAWENYQEILPFVDLFLYDIKHLDDQKHRQLTGQSNQLILANLERIAKSGKSIIARIPLIPGQNTNSENIAETINLLQRLAITTAHLLPYHQLGTHKYAELGLDYPMPEPTAWTDDDIEAIKYQFEQAGIDVILFNHG